MRTLLEKSIDELDQEVSAREQEAAKMQPGTAKQSILKDAAQLRMYVEFKRWMAQTPKTPDRLKPQARAKQNAAKADSETRS